MGKFMLIIPIMMGSIFFATSVTAMAEEDVAIIVTSEDVESDRSRFYVESDDTLNTIINDEDATLNDKLKNLKVKDSSKESAEAKTKESTASTKESIDNAETSTELSSAIDADLLAKAKKENIGSEVTQYIDEDASAKIIAEAEKYIGVDYVWGGKTPAGFDCSGFTQYVFRHALGIEIGEWTLPQSQYGERIDVKDAKAGDLYFWGEGTPRHVALSVGDGVYLHAPQPGEQVRYNTTSWYMPDYAIRIIE